MTEENTKETTEEVTKLIKVKDIAEEFGIKPMVLRAKLRSSGIQKPESGRWTWEEGDPQIDLVRDIAKTLSEAPKRERKRKEPVGVDENVEETEDTEEETDQELMDEADGIDLDI